MRCEPIIRLFRKESLRLEKIFLQINMGNTELLTSTLFANGNKIPIDFWVFFSISMVEKKKVSKMSAKNVYIFPKRFLLSCPRKGSEATQKENSKYVMNYKSENFSWDKWENGILEER